VYGKNERPQADAQGRVIATVQHHRRTIMRRRSVLLSVVSAAIASAFAVKSSTAAQEAPPGSLAGHPLTGTWLVNTPGGLSPAIFAADGSVVLGVTPNYVDPQLGLTFQGPLLGTWQPDGERSGQQTVVQALSDANGTYTGTFMFDGYPEVSADGQTFTASKPQRVVVRDATNTITFDQVVPMEPPVTATRIGATIDSVVFPAATPMAGTPTT
jgi:hypothetical protein